MSNQPVDQSRRTWVTMACAAGGVGGVATAIPFVSTFQPSERAKAAGAAVEADISALKPGEISQPVQSPFGGHLIVVEERRVQDVSDDRKRAAARNALRERKSDEAFQDWLRQLRDRAYVEYRLEER